MKQTLFQPARHFARGGPPTNELNRTEVAAGVWENNIALAREACKRGKKTNT